MPSTATNRLQGLTTSVAVKPPCITVATSNITLSGLQTISGVTVVEDDRVLVKGQSTASENGIYNASTGSWTRAKDFDGYLDAVSGTRVLVVSAGSNGVEYELTTTDPIVIGTTALTFTLRYGANATYDQTEAEIAAGVTVASHAIDTTDYTKVNRYITNTIDGINSQAAAFQSAINIAKISGKAITFDEPPIGASYIIDAELDLTTPLVEAGTRYGFTFRGNGNMLAVTPNAPYRPTIIFKHTGHAVDCTGSLGITFENVSLGTDTSTYPKTCFLLARNSTGGGSIHQFRNVRVMGNFSEAVVYNYGAEDDEYHGCQFFNREGGANAKVAVFTGYNIRGLSSTFTTIATGSQSTIDHNFYGGTYYNLTNHANGDVFYFESIYSFKMFGGWVAAGASTGANPRSLFYVDATNGPTNLVTLHGVTGEHLPELQTYGIRFGGETAATHSRWSVRDCTLPNVTAMVSAHVDATIDSSVFENLSSQSVGGGLVFLGTLQNSHIAERSENISIGTSVDNTIDASIANLAVTTRSGDYWGGPDNNLTWTPGTGAITHGGTLTISNKTVHYQGRQVTVTMSLQDSVSMSWAANTSITGLPVACINGRGMVSVVNVTSGASLGNGSVNGTSIKLPVLAAGGTDEIAITAMYFVT